MFFGWRVVAGSFASMLLITGFYTYSVSLLVSPVRAEFGVSLEQVMYGLTLGTLLGLVTSPIMGIMIDRYSLRAMMTVGCLLTALGFWLLSGTESILTFNLIFGVTMTVSNSLAGSITGSAAVSRWFTASRGKALGIASMGTSVGGIAVPALITWWLELSGWRGALENLALLTLLLITPWVFINIRGKPADIGQQAESSGNDDPVQPLPEGAPVTPALTMADIVRMPAFWQIGISLGLVFCAYSSILANLSPYATDLDISEAQASAMIMTLAIFGLIGKLGFGIAADRIPLKFGLWSAHALIISSFSLLATEPPYSLMLVAAAMLGLATGGMLPVWNAMVAQTFGIDSFGRAMGAMGPVITLCVMPGFTVVGRLYDHTGNYTVALLSFCVIVTIAAALLVPLKLTARDS